MFIIAHYPDYPLNRVRGTHAGPAKFHHKHTFSIANSPDLSKGVFEDFLGVEQCFFQTGGYSSQQNAPAAQF
jgi:hypothetical protein